MLAAIVVVLAVIGAGFGAYQLTKSDGTASDQASSEYVGGTGGDSGSSDVSADDGSTVDDGAIADEASSSSDDPVSDGAGSDGSSSDGTTAGVTAGGDFVDDAHIVSFAVPSELSLVQDFDGYSAVWESDDLTFEYDVIPGGSVADADDRYAELLGSLATVTFDSDTPDGRADGRYVVSGYYPDGGRIYERGKVRCGDLVSYRLTWLYDESKPLVNRLTESLVNDDPDLDSMGGDYASC